MKIDRARGYEYALTAGCLACLVSSDLRPFDVLTPTPSPSESIRAIIAIIYSSASPFIHFSSFYALFDHNRTDSILLRLSGPHDLLPYFGHSTHCLPPSIINLFLFAHPPENLIASLLHMAPTWQLSVYGLLSLNIFSNLLPRHQLAYPHTFAS